MSKVGVVVPCLKYYKGLAETVESIRTQEQWELFVIPNWRDNNVLAASWNMGTERAMERDCDYILICNDDILLSETAIDHMVGYFESAPDETVMVTGRNVKAALADPYEIFHYNPTVFDDPECPDFSCFMIRAETYEVVGSFDENFIPAYFEDNDYHRRINLMGYKAVNYGGAPFYHFGSLTQNLEGPVCTSDMFVGNRSYYASKWGGEPGQEQYATPFNKGGSLSEWTHIRANTSTIGVSF